MSWPAMPAAPTAAIPFRPLPRLSASATPRSAAASRTPITSAARHQLRIVDSADRCRHLHRCRGFHEHRSRLQQHVERTTDVHHQPSHAKRRGQRCRWHLQRQSLPGHRHGHWHWQRLGQRQLCVHLLRRQLGHQFRFVDGADCRRNLHRCRKLSRAPIPTTAARRAHH